MDEALEVLRAMRKFTFGYAIDSILASMYGDLINFEYDDAASRARDLLDLAKESRRESGPAVRKRILAVDDVPDMLNAVKAILREEFAVYAVTNHAAALKFLGNNGADLILLDIEMPGMDGFQLLDAIRRLEAYRETPVFFLTGSVTVENIVRARKAGASDFIKKPIDAQVLLAKVRKRVG
jgi:CheY-like chemotaxis protein